MKILPIIKNNLVFLFIVVSNSCFSDINIPLVFENTTQGPLWPPSSVVDENGNFVVVGNIIYPIDQFENTLIPGAVIVDKDSTPPLDRYGKEDFTNLLDSHYTIIRELDLSEGSPDLDIELYSTSFGPPRGDFGGGYRIPMGGTSRYNLNGASVNGDHCTELFPAKSQELSYKRRSFPLAEVPIPGFQGDQILYDVDSGQSSIPRLSNGDCPPVGCLGEDKLDFRDSSTITLGTWLDASVEGNIVLTNYDVDSMAYTSAQVKIEAKNLVPNSIYTIVVIRRNVFEGLPIRKAPNLASLNSIIMSNEEGAGEITFSVEHPFPSFDSDIKGNRILGFALAFKSDRTLAGSCPMRLGPGVDTHAVVSTLGNIETNELLSQLITVPKN